jgi:manganese/zinc/iron transport system substrate-binding protein
MITRWTVLTGLLAGLLVGPVSALAQPMVLGTTGMVADTVDAVGGECVEARALMGPGVDPHLYQASASDVRAFQQADLIVYNGFGLEGQLDDVLTRFGERRATLALAEAAAAQGPGGAIDGAGDFATDPHLWMDAALWSQGAAPLGEALAAIAPDCRDAIIARADALEARLQALDRWIEESVASIPAAQRILLTAHDAFRYYGRAYDIEVQGVQGISTSAEASVADIRATTALIAERDIPAIFVETTINPRNIEAVVKAARERSAEVSIGGTLYGDALGEPGTLADSLVGMLMHNTARITGALGGELAPLPPALAGRREALDALRSRDG